MPDNIFVTRIVAAHTGGAMADEAPTGDKYPGWRFHLTLPAVVVNSAEEEQALPEGYVARVITDEERAAAASAPAPEEGSTTARTSRR